VLIVDALIVKGVKFVLTRLAEVVEAELVDETHMREELLAAQMKLELGEIDEAEFSEIEESVLAGLREIRGRKEGATRDVAAVSAEADDARYTVESVDADLSHVGRGDDDEP
jgi:hypothetical protein